MIKYIALISIVVTLLSCGNGGGEYGDNLFSLEVVDSDGLPLSGLEVRVNNDFVNELYSRPVTSIRFQLAYSYNIDLKVYDLQDSLVIILAEDQLTSPGQYCYVCSIAGEDSINVGGANVFRYELVARDEDSTEVFRESKYMCMLASLEQNLCKIGETSENGWFTFNNVLAFPHLLDLGEQPLLDENAVCDGTFTLSDYIGIMLINHDTQEYQTYTKLMRSTESNHYKLIWNNPQEYTSRLSKSVSPPDYIYTQPIDNGNDDQPLNVYLYQNYPNPFN